MDADGAAERRSSDTSFRRGSGSRAHHRCIPALVVKHFLGSGFALWPLPSGLCVDELAPRSHAPAANRWSSSTTDFCPICSIIVHQLLPLDERLSRVPSVVRVDQ